MQEYITYKRMLNILYGPDITNEMYESFLNDEKEVISLIETLKKLAEFNSIDDKTKKRGYDIVSYCREHKVVREEDYFELLNQVVRILNRHKKDESEDFFLIDIAIRLDIEKILSTKKYEIKDVELIKSLIAFDYEVLLDHIINESGENQNDFYCKVLKNPQIYLLSLRKILNEFSYAFTLESFQTRTNYLLSEISKIQLDRESKKVCKSLKRQIKRM